MANPLVIESIENVADCKSATFLTWSLETRDSFKPLSIERSIFKSHSAFNGLFVVVP